MTGLARPVAPLKVHEGAFHSRGGACGAAKVESRNFTPVQGGGLVINVDDNLLGVCRPDRSEELVAGDHADLILGRVNLQARRRLHEPDDSNLSHGSGQARSSVATGRPGRDPKVSSGPEGPLP